MLGPYNLVRLIIRGFLYVSKNILIIKLLRKIATLPIICATRQGIGWIQGRVVLSVSASAHITTHVSWRCRCLDLMQSGNATLFNCAHWRLQAVGGRRQAGGGRLAAGFTGMGSSRLLEPVLCCSATWKRSSPSAVHWSSDLTVLRPSHSPSFCCVTAHHHHRRRRRHSPLVGRPKRTSRGSKSESPAAQRERLNKSEARGSIVKDTATSTGEETGSGSWSIIACKTY